MKGVINMHRPSNLNQNTSGMDFNNQVNKLIVSEHKNAYNRNESEIDDSHIKAELFNIFDDYKYDDEIIACLRSLCAERVISNAEYNLAIKNYNDYLAEWEEYKRDTL